jgi:hypothetical protein
MPSQGLAELSTVSHGSTDLRERIEALRQQRVEQMVRERLTRPTGKTDASRDLVILAKDRRIKELETENQKLQQQLKVALAKAYEQLCTGQFPRVAQRHELNTNAPAGPSSRFRVAFFSAEARTLVARRPSGRGDDGKDEDGHKEQQGHDGAYESEYSTSQEILGPISVAQDEG